MEIWKEIKETNGTHSVSNYGRIRSNGYWVKTGHGGKRWAKPIIKKVSYCKNGYARLTLKRGVQSTLHRLIAKYFIPNPNNYTFVNHKDGNKHNHSIDNLEWCTRQQNEDHAFSTGLKNSTGSANTQAKLNEEKVKFILNNKSKYSSKEFSVMFDIHVATINRIKQRVIWKHV
jgi:hypothetical protein